MKNISFAMTVFVFLHLSGLIVSYPSSRRKIALMSSPISMTPNGSGTNDYPTLMHVSAAGNVDMIHHIWDFSYRPTIFIAVTSLETDVLVDWKKLQRKTVDYITFSTPPIYSAALVLSRIWLYTNSFKTASLAAMQSNNVTAYSTSNLTWTCHKKSLKSGDTAMLVMLGTNPELFGKGHIQITLKTYGELDFDSEIPYMVHSENGTIVDIVLNRLDTNSSTKVATEIVLMTSERSSSLAQGFQMKLRKSLDDEHTPGVFNVIDIFSPDSFNHKNGSYIYYRPISYTSSERVISLSTDLHASVPMCDVQSTSIFNTSPFASFFSHEVNWNGFLVQSINISFGTSEQDNENVNFNTWTFEFGYGAPPEELLSRFVVIVTTVGFVFPMMCLFLGGFVVLVKRLRIWIVV